MDYRTVPYIFGGKKFVKKFPPFCIHFYKDRVTDFPFCSPDFGTIEEALSYAAAHYFECRFARLGFWTGKKYPDRYFYLLDIDVQNSFFEVI